MPMEIEARIRDFVENAYAKGLETLRLTQLESQAIAQVEDARSELGRAGRRFGGGCQIIANGIAPVAAIPTTTATLALYNNEEAGGMVYFVRRISAPWVGSGTPAAGATVFACISPSRIASPPTVMVTGYGAASLSGSTRRTKALFATAVTLPSTPAAPAWIQIHSSLQLAAANVGEGDGIGTEFDGELVVPPGYALGLAILSGAGTTPLYGLSVTWAEKQVTLR